ncbi:unnamed protein product [Mytilus coruscus]|uniref:Core-binding (CB) domain-containing protein n=1 Tax=Mytilus coruscus TaxID=42192 RepID=A0A6J8ABJ4_MYTCO|nr:unnamed protein product [Mytilus coruscus]
MVSHAVNNDDCRPNPSTQFSPDPPIIDGSIPSTGQVRDLSSGSLEGIGGHTITANLSKAAAELYSKAWRSGTRASYKSAWKRWSSWCNSREINPIQTSVENIIQFLTTLFNEQKQYRTINTYRSAISRGHNLLNSMSVGKHPAIIHHMRAICNVRTPLPRYQSSWDVDKVLSCITGWGDNSSLSMKILVQKLTMLLALTSAGRVSEIHKLNLDFMCDKGDHIIFQIPSLSKTCRPGKTKPELKFYKFEDNNLCVVECLRKYLELTEKNQGYQ